MLLVATGVLVLLIAGAAFFHYYNPLAPTDSDELAAKKLGSMPALPSSVRFGEMTTGMTHLQVIEKYEDYWQKIEDDMHKSGVSDAEVRGVLATARREFGGDDSGFIYGVPIKAERVWVRFKPVWVIKFGWGTGESSFYTEPPGHVRTLVIERQRPYRQLGMATCG